MSPTNVGNTFFAPATNVADVFLVPAPTLVGEGEQWYIYTGYKRVDNLNIIAEENCHPTNGVRALKAKTTQLELYSVCETPVIHHY